MCLPLASFAQNMPIFAKKNSKGLLTSHLLCAQVHYFKCRHAANTLSTESDLIAMLMRCVSLYCERAYIL